VNLILRRAATSLLLITLVASAARAVFALYESREIPDQALRVIPFQTETGHIAYSLASGKGFSSPFQRDTGPTAWLTPVYPFLLAAIFKLFGVYTLGSLFVAIAFNIVFSALACVPIFHVGLRVGGLGVASAAAWLWALFPNAVIIPFEWVWDTSLSTLLAATLLWATLVVARTFRLRDWCLYGLLWGIALLTNPALALLLPILLAWAAWRIPARGNSRLVHPLLAAAIAILCCVPWTVRNYIQFHKFIPLRSNFAFELYIGNNENYDEAHRFRPGAITQDREILRYVRRGETAFMDEERRKALAFITANPRTELRLIALRFVEFWMGTPTPIATFRETPSAILRALLLCNYLAPLGALLGIVVLLVKKSPYAVPLIAFPLVFPLLYYVTHTSLRYRHPIDPVVLLLTAIAVCGVRRLACTERSERDASFPAGDQPRSAPTPL
jgi:4-amino-4-deoxy-L-arabinose transferase-like glycosyltransferase